MMSQAGSGKVPENYKNRITLKVFFVHLHCPQDELNGEIDLNDQIDVVLSKEASGEADDNQQNSWNKNCQQEVDNRPVQGHFNNDRFLVIDI